MAVGYSTSGRERQWLFCTSSSDPTGKYPPLPILFSRLIDVTCSGAPKNINDHKSQLTTLGFLVN